MKLSKRMKEAQSKIDKSKVYSIEEALKLLKETSKVKFDASVETHIHVGIDVKKSEQMVRSQVTLPHGTGKTIRIAAFVPEADTKKAKAAGASVVGSDELIDKIKSDSKCEFDVAVATPDMMKKLAVIARILGQKGLMPNPKTGTITPDFEKAIKELVQGKLSYKNDASGNIHASIGKISFDDKKLIENFTALLESVKKAKPDGLKGAFLKTLYIASSMGPSIKVQA